MMVYVITDKKRLKSPYIEYLNYLNNYDMAKWIFTTEFKGQRIFIVCQLCKWLLDIEKRIGCTIEPAGLTDEILGRGYIANRGQIYSLKGFKSLLNSLGY